MSPHDPANANDASHWRQRWLLPDDVTYLNHGSFGPSPREVVEARQQWYRQLESQPMELLARRLEPALHEVTERLASFVGTSGENLVLLDNATTGINVVAASVPLKAGDEVLLSDHEYGAVERIWRRKCDECGARLVVQKLPAVLTDADEVCDALLSAATTRTRLLVFSHLTSPTALVLPAEQITRRARARGMMVCIDGPHALAMRPLALDQLDCDFYSASCHKWLCGPFGTGFLYAHPRVQAQVRPVVVSWGGWPEQAPQWRKEFTWSGTRDPSGFLALPTAIDFLESAGLEMFRQRTHALARYARERLSGFSDSPALSDDSLQWYGSMVSVPLPAGEAKPLQAALWERHRIEAPVFAWQGRRLLRVSCHLYTSRGDIDRLVEALPPLVGC